MPDTTLFSGGELRLHLADLRKRLVAEVQAADEDYLLNADKEQWAAYLAKKYSVDVPELRPVEKWAEDHGEQPVDVSHEHFQRAILDPSQPTYVPGRAVTVHIPFLGNAQLFQMRASTFSMNPPRATVRGGNSGELALRFEFPHDRRPAIEAAVRQPISHVEQHLTWQRGDVAPHNAGLLGDARQAITNRRQRVLRDHEYLDGLGIPVKKRADAPTTYAATGITRRPAPHAPLRGRSGGASQEASVPRALEPTLVGEFYEHICRVIRAMGHSMERAPETYGSWEEERLRDNLVVMLNSHYEGQATGETFNRAGKTDILVRVEDRNVFIGECKWWSGPSDFDDALDQLFGYTTWRDTKIALVMFVQAKGLTAIIEKGRVTLADYPQFLSWEEAGDDGELRARMSWPGDDERHATLTVFFFHLAAA